MAKKSKIAKDARRRVIVARYAERRAELLMLAAYHGHPGTVKSLLERGADPNRLNDRGQSPLAGAVFKNEPDVVEALVAAGADATVGRPSAIDTARMFDNTELLTLLQP